MLLFLVLRRRKRFARTFGRRGRKRSADRARPSRARGARRSTRTASRSRRPSIAASSAPAASAQSAVVAGAAGVSRLEYVLQDGITSLYDMDHEYKLVKTISLPSTKDEVRGVTVAPSTHIMYVMHGGDGPINGSMFLAWIVQFLVPTLRVGDIVVLDNLGSHKSQLVRRAIRDAGAMGGPGRGSSPLVRRRRGEAPCSGHRPSTTS